jgi:hypothetical protein
MLYASIDAEAEKAYFERKKMLLMFTLFFR